MALYNVTLQYFLQKDNCSVYEKYMKNSVSNLEKPEFELCSIVGMSQPMNKYEKPSIGLFPDFWFHFQGVVQIDVRVLGILTPDD